MKDKHRLFMMAFVWWSFALSLMILTGAWYSILPAEVKGHVASGVAATFVSRAFWVAGAAAYTRSQEVK